METLGPGVQNTLPTPSWKLAGPASKTGVTQGTQRRAQGANIKHISGKSNPQRPNLTAHTTQRIHYQCPGARYRYSSPPKPSLVALGNLEAGLMPRAVCQDPLVIPEQMFGPHECQDTRFSSGSTSQHKSVFHPSIHPSKAIHQKQTRVNYLAKGHVNM